METSTTDLLVKALFLCFLAHNTRERDEATHEDLSVVDNLTVWSIDGDQFCDMAILIKALGRKRDSYLCPRDQKLEVGLLAANSLYRPDSSR